MWSELGSLPVPKPMFMIYWFRTLKTQPQFSQASLGKISPVYLHAICEVCALRPISTFLTKHPRSSHLQETKWQYNQSSHYISANCLSICTYLITLLASAVNKLCKLTIWSLSCSVTMFVTKLYHSYNCSRLPVLKPFNFFHCSGLQGLLSFHKLSYYNSHTVIIFLIILRNYPVNSTPLMIHKQLDLFKRGKANLTEGNFHGWC